jgi:2-polyprenyl-6-methoxyphenol hydroxylase-like FAD-dependent oxidoreductase
VSAQIAAERTTCCIVGGGPGGVVLALLLARRGVPVTLLEQHADFDRDFRGDTIHPSVLEIMDQLGLAGGLLELPHTRISNATVQTPAGPFTPVDFRRLRTKFPYIAFMPQTRFLEFVVGEAERYPNFRRLMGASARGLVEEGGVVRGVRYRTPEGTRELRALLTVGADGRFSRLRRLAGFEPESTSPPMDVLWFRLPRKPGEPRGAVGRFGRGHLGILLDRGEQWQVAYVIPKGSYGEVREQGLESLRRSLADLLPELVDRLECLEEWGQVSVLSVASDRLRRWYKPGLLLIGDAAHTMSPVGGVGINYAIQDAVVAANVLAEPLVRGEVGMGYLARVQRRRELPTRIIQVLQAQVQRRLLAPALGSNRPLTPPKALVLLTKVPLVRDIPGRVIGLGVWPVRVEG